MGGLAVMKTTRQKIRSAQGKNDLTIKHPGYTNMKTLSAGDTPSRAHTALNPRKKNGPGSKPYHGTKPSLGDALGMKRRLG